MTAYGLDLLWRCPAGQFERKITRIELPYKDRKQLADSANFNGAPDKEGCSSRTE
jgi:hypothetical protein